MTQLNPYQTTWVLMIPIKGIAPIKDRKYFETIFKIKFFRRQKYILFHAPNRDMAIDKLFKHQHKLSKEYAVHMITDKQFGLMPRDVNILQGFTEVITQKQLDKVFLISSCSIKTGYFR